MNPTRTGRWLRCTIAAALAALATTVGAQAYTVQGEGFQVTSAGFQPTVIDGTTLSWPGSGLFEARTSEVSSFGSTGEQTHLTWAAAAGYRIAGFTVAYDLGFRGGSYLITGEEPYADDFGGLQPGDTWVSTARFDTTSGPPALFEGAEPETLLLVHEVAGDQFNAVFEMTVHGLREFCRTAADCFDVPIPITYFVITELFLGSIAITPHIVAVPEPQVWLSLAAGLLVLGFAAHRSAAQRREPRILASAHPVTRMPGRPREAVR